MGEQLESLGQGTWGTSWSKPTGGRGRTQRSWKQLPLSNFLWVASFLLDISVDPLAPPRPVLEPPVWSAVRPWLLDLLVPCHAASPTNPRLPARAFAFASFSRKGHFWAFLSSHLPPGQDQRWAVAAALRLIPASSPSCLCSFSPDLPYSTYAGIQAQVRPGMGTGHVCLQSQ